MRLFLMLAGLLAFFAFPAFAADAPALPPDVAALLDEADEARAAYKYDKAQQLLEKAAESGNPEVMYRLGQFVSDVRGYNDPAYLTWMQKAAEGGSAQAMYRLAMYYGGAGSSARDPEKCLYWHQEAARHGEKWSMDKLGDIFAKGEIAPKDDKAACSWYARAAELGDTDAMYKAGRCLAEGRGAAHDPKGAFTWFKGASMDSRDAAYKLAQCYANGFGTEKDPVLAMIWRIRAFDMGSWDSAYELAQSYAAGSGAPRNMQLACLYFKEARQSLKQEYRAEAYYQFGLCIRDGFYETDRTYEESGSYNRAVQEGHVKALAELFRMAAQEDDDALRAIGSAFYRGNADSLAYLKTLSLNADNAFPGAVILPAQYALCEGVSRRDWKTTAEEAAALFEIAASQPKIADCVRKYINEQASQNNSQALDITCRWAADGDDSSKRAIRIDGLVCP